MKQRLRVLMVAYACDPRGGGEHWLGWGWAREAAKHHDVVLIAPPRAEKSIREAAHGLSLSFHPVGLPGWLRQASERLGVGGTWLRKQAWQHLVFKEATKLHAAEPFDIVHQTTFHTFRIPFRCAELRIPSVWGPIAGGESVPPGFEKYLGPFARGEARRSAINRWCLRAPAVRKSLRCASAILVSNRTTLAFLPAEHHPKCRIVAPNAVPDGETGPVAPFCRQTEAAFEIVFAGACAATRAMPLVFEALARGIGSDWKMTVAGDGPALDFWKSEARRLDLTEHVSFPGRIPREELSRVYERASVLVFPALRDSGGSAILDAMTTGIPILTLNWAGPGEMVDSSCAMLAGATDPESTVAEIREGLEMLAKNPEAGIDLADKAFQQAADRFSWRRKFEEVDKLYRNLASKTGNSCPLAQNT
jgi:glycosyltransferase involved in cell wall biosynthesis